MYAQGSKIAIKSRIFQFLPEKYLILEKRPKVIMSKLKIHVRYFRRFLTTVILSEKTWNYFFEFLGEFQG